MFFWLANGIFDSVPTEMIWVIFVAVAGAIGSLLKKKKQDGQPADGARPGSGRGPTSAPPRPPQVRRPQPVRPGQRPPMTPTPARPAPVQQQPVRRVESIPAATPARRSDLSERTPARQSVKPVQESTTHRLLKDSQDTISLDAAAQDRAAFQARLKQLLRDQSGLRAAFVLSEIINPPLSLRDGDHLK